LVSFLAHPTNNDKINRENKLLFMFELFDAKLHKLPNMPFHSCNFDVCLDLKSLV